MGFKTMGKPAMETMGKPLHKPERIAPPRKRWLGQSLENWLCAVFSSSGFVKLVLTLMFCRTRVKNKIYSITIKD